MIDALFTQPNYVAAKKLMDVTALRQAAISANLAHLETPNYKRIDVAPAFEQQLQRAVAQGKPAVVAAMEPTLAIDPTAVANRRDGNTVDLENEMYQMYRNSLEHALETQLVSGHLLKMRMAITGRPA
jgi:flagellar basal-body rod protein FlgB